MRLCLAIDRNRRLEEHNRADVATATGSAFQWKGEVKSYSCGGSET